MNALDLDAIEGRVEKATPGPWTNSDATAHPDGSNFTENVTVAGWDVACCPGGDTHPEEGREEQAAADASFIAHARQDVPALVAELRRYQAITLDDLAAAFSRGRGNVPTWEGLTGYEQDWARARMLPVFELLRGPAPEPSAAELATMARFGLDKPQGPVEFDFTPGGGDAA